MKPDRKITSNINTELGLEVCKEAGKSIFSEIQYEPFTMLGHLHGYLIWWLHYSVVMLFNSEGGSSPLNSIRKNFFENCRLPQGRLTPGLAQEVPTQWYSGSQIICQIPYTWVICFLHLSFCQVRTRHWKSEHAQDQGSPTTVRLKNQTS